MRYPLLVRWLLHVMLSQFNARGRSAHIGFRVQPVVWCVAALPQAVPGGQACLTDTTRATAAAAVFMCSCMVAI